MHRIMQKYRISNHSVAVFYTCYVYNMQLNSCSLKHDCLNKSVNRKASPKNRGGVSYKQGDIVFGQTDQQCAATGGRGECLTYLEKNSGHSRTLSSKLFKKDFKK